MRGILAHAVGKENAHHVCHVRKRKVGPDASGPTFCLEREEEREDDDHHDSHQDLEREADLHIIHEGILAG